MNHTITQSVQNLPCYLLSNLQAYFDFYEHFAARRDRKKEGKNKKSQERSKERRNEGGGSDKGNIVLQGSIRVLLL
jgi:hypothetical protein